MKIIKVILRTVFIVLAIACFFTFGSVGFSEATIMAVGMAIFGFVVTHPLAIQQENYEGYDLESYRVGVFTLAAGIFVGTVGAVICKALAMKILSVAFSLMVVYFGVLRINKSKGEKSAE